MDDAQRRRQTWLICLGLALAILAAYAPVWRAGFISYDDPVYVTSNSNIQDGLSWKGFAWAFTTTHASIWHPLTWLSYLTDYQLYGMNPRGFHFTNVLLHIANSILLFLVLDRMTAARWPSAWTAALFALHPTHVESVAWISERKDVLSTLFWMLTMLAYARWAEERRSGKPEGKKFYVASVILFAMGLMAKPMLVTLPFVLLLLDAWPLQRRDVPVSKLLLEKAPFLVLAAASCVVTLAVPIEEGELKSLATVPMDMRLENVPVAYARYIGKTFWPAHLAVPYPMETWPVWAVTGSVALLLLLTALALSLRRSQPWLAVGWLWFIGTLTPVIGLVQAGAHGLADRYHYIPGIGLFIAIVWTGREWCARAGKRTGAALGALTAAICLVLTARQAALWQNSEVLFQHAIQNTKNNYVAYNTLGWCAYDRGQIATAIDYFETAVRARPQESRLFNDLGKVLLGTGRIDEAVARLRMAVSLQPGFADARYNLGHALLAKGQLGDALDQFQAEVDLTPHDFGAQDNMGAVLLEHGLAADSLPFLRAAVAIKPGDAEAGYLLGNALFRTGRVADAISQYEKVIAIDPAQTKARNDLAWIFACAPDSSIRNGPKAVELALRADQLSGGTNPVIAGTLAAGYAEAGEFPEAVAAEKRARQVALTQTNAALADELQKRLRLYEAGQPNRIAISKAAPPGG